MKKILIIEEDGATREKLSELLRLGNYHVITAENGKSGIVQAMKYLPDLILCDVSMPEPDGYSVLRNIQGNPVLKDKPFIFLSAGSDPSEFRLGGRNECLMKRFTSTDLLHSIECCLNNSVECGLSPGKLIRFTPDEEGLNPKDAIKEFVSDRNIILLRKNQSVFREGNHPKNVYYIIRGQVKAFKTHEDGKELIMRLYGPGEFFGYVAILQNTTYKVSVQTIENCEIAVIPRADFDEFINSQASVLRMFIRLLASEVADYEQLLLSMAYNSLRKKVADTLLRLIRKFERNNPEQNSFSFSRPNLAALAGTATESLIRTLSDFKKEKLIDITDGHITVLDTFRLKRIAN